MTLISCRNGNVDNDVPSIAISSDGVVTVDPSSPLAKRISTDIVSIKPYCAHFTASGTVRAIPSRYAEVATPMPGRVVRSFVSLGDHIAAGAPLFQINSSDYMEICRTFFDAKQELEQSHRALERAKRLHDNKMGTARELEEAETDFKLRQQAYDNAASALKIYGSNPENVRLGEPMTVYAPISGRIVTDNVVTGQYVADDSDPMVVIADLRKVWVTANVKEKDFNKLSALDKVEIQTSSTRDSLIAGTVYHVNDILDPETRSVEVIIECDNTDSRLKPNMFCTVHLTDSETEATIVPTSALLQSESGNYVMKTDGYCRYRKIPVIAGTTDGDSTIIESGIAPNDSIIVKGAFYLIDAR